MVQFRRIKDFEENPGIKIAEAAFRKDSFFRAVTKEKEKSYHLLMEMLMKVWLKSQIAFVAETEERIVGIALLASDELAALSVGDCIKAGAGKVILSCGIKNILAFLRASSCFNEDFQQIPNPRYYLSLLAVDPSFQGQGIGTAMLRECVIPFLREKSCRTLCLNTNEEINREFYRKNDFEEIGEKALQINGKRICNWSYKMDLPDGAGEAFPPD